MAGTMTEHPTVPLNSAERALVDVFAAERGLSREAAMKKLVFYGLVNARRHEAKVKALRGVHAEAV